MNCKDSVYIQADDCSHGTDRWRQGGDSVATGSASSTQLSNVAALLTPDYPPARAWRHGCGAMRRKCALLSKWTWSWTRALKASRPRLMLALGVGLHQ